MTVAACGDDGSDGGGSTRGEEQLDIAFMAFASDNGFAQAVYNGVKEAAAKNNATAEILDGQFDSKVQFNQLEDIIATKQYDGVVLAANDGVGIASAVERAIQEGIKVAVVNNTVGPDLNDLEPQIEGLTTTIGSNQEESSTEQAEFAVDLCADKDPCRVVEFHGNLDFPYDNVRRDAWNAVFEKHPNIEVVADPEGEYSRETSLAAMQDVLQANQDIDLVMSAADQHIFGAELALERAGIDIDATGKSGVMLLGRGASTEAIEQVRAGKWAGTYVDLPETDGRLATEALIKDLRGEDDFPPFEDVVKYSPVGPFATPDNIDEAPDFKGEWVG